MHNVLLLHMGKHKIKKNCSVKSVKGFTVIQEMNLGMLYQHLNEEAFSILLNTANMHTIYWGLRWMHVRSQIGVFAPCSTLRQRQLAAFWQVQLCRTARIMSQTGSHGN